MTSTIAMILHAVYGLAGAAIGTALLITGHIDAATGIALIAGGLGIGGIGAVATNAVTQANATVPADKVTVLPWPLPVVPH